MNKTRGCDKKPRDTAKAFRVEFGKRLVFLMTLNDVAAHEIGAACQVDRTAVYAWRSGKACPSLDKLVPLAEALKVDVGDLFVRPDLFARPLSEDGGAKK